MPNNFTAIAALFGPSLNVSNLSATSARSVSADLILPLESFTEIPRESKPRFDFSDPAAASAAVTANFFSPFSKPSKPKPPSSAAVFSELSVSALIPVFCLRSFN